MARYINNILDDQVKTTSPDTSKSLGRFESVSFFSGFKKIFIYFWITSLVGHYWEVIWATFKHVILGQQYWGPTNITLIPLAAPYGFGAIAIILFIFPLIKKYKLTPASVFILNAIATSAVEYICAATLVLVVGKNTFWNYSNHFLNINGYVCLESALAFGIISTLYVYYLHPMLTNFLNKLNKKNYDIFFWTILVSYLIDLLYAGIRSHLI
jgi:uncharacterized membrane protein